MKLTVATAALLGCTQAITNSTSDGKSEVATWVDGKELYETRDDRMCKESNECGPDYVCAEHQWEYNNQQESARGCWHKSICKPSTLGSFWMFDGRAIQFWCDKDDMQTIGPEQNYGDLAYPIWEAGAQHWDEWSVTCSSHDECRQRNGDPKQHCTDIIWTAMEDQRSWGNGTACYGWDENMCLDMETDGQQTFSIRNSSYDTTKFSYHTQLWCMGPDFGFDGGVQAQAADAMAGDRVMDDRIDYSDPNERKGSDSDDRRGDSDDRRGSDSDDRRGDADFSTGMVLEQDSDGMRLEMRLSATKLAATAATAIVAATLF